MSTLHVKNMIDLVSGELVLLDFSNVAGLAIFIKRLEDENGLFGVLNSKAFDGPMAIFADGLDGDVLSYGTEWLLIDSAGSETRLTRNFAEYDNCALFIDKLSRYVRFQKYGNPGARPVYFDLQLKTEKRELRSYAAPVLNWEIWNSAEDYANPRGKPLFTFPIA